MTLQTSQVTKLNEISNRLNTEHDTNRFFKGEFLQNFQKHFKNKFLIIKSKYKIVIVVVKSYKI